MLAGQGKKRKGREKRKGRAYEDITKYNPGKRQNVRICCISMVKGLVLIWRFYSEHSCFIHPFTQALLSMQVLSI